MDNSERQGSVPENDRADRRSLYLLLFVLGLISAAGVAYIIVAPVNSWFPAATSQAREVDGLFKFMLAASFVIVVYVQGLILSFVRRYRRQKNEPETALGVQRHGNVRLETAWSVGPSLLILFIVIISLKVYTDEYNQQSNELLLNVRGFQYGFAFSLPQYGIKDNATVVLPVNRPVYVTETASDVIHAFWVPEFRTQYDMVPGIFTHERFKPVETGTFRVICTQYCGTGHAGMHTTITVGSEADFVSWLRKNGAKTLPPAGAAAAMIRP